jgi:hypothetical protein
LQRAGDDAGIVQATLTLAVLLFHEAGVRRASR